MSDDQLTVIRAVGMEDLPVIARMNRELFGEDRIINRFDRNDLMMLVATVDDQPAGFKIGYGLPDRAFYSAKGGVMTGFRRRGIARDLLDAMSRRAWSLGYTTLTFDTFPAVHPGMARLAIDEGFVLTRADFSQTYRNYRLRFSTRLTDFEGTRQAPG